MKISPHGFDYNTKKSSFRSIVLDEFRKKILVGIKNSKEIMPTKDLDLKSYRSLPQVGGANEFDPDEAGWTFLINKKNLLGEQIIKAISPLAKYRKMDNIESPLLFNDTPKQFWDDWITEYENLKRGKFQIPPMYILIVGDPDSIPFEFQSILSTVAFVGRLDFDDVTELAAYAEKVERIEGDNKKNYVNRIATFFATDYGVNSTGCYDPTHLSLLDIEKEIAPKVQTLHEDFPDVGGPFEIDRCFKADATKEKLFESITKKKPLLVYASSWGMCAPGERMDLQKEYAGAICCQGDPDKSSSEELLITGSSIPDGPFLEGGVFFQQSSFSYGTPASSILHKFIPEAERWEMPKQIAPTSFVAALPKRLVFHKNGPLAFIGHFDEMLSFTYSEGEDYQDNRKTRLKPISGIIQKILLGNPVGYAVGNSLNTRLSIIERKINDLVAQMPEKVETDGQKHKEEELLTDLSNKFLERHQFKNYMIFGDPAVRI